MITQTLQLNLVPKGVWPRLYVSQYDAGSRTLTFEIYNGDQRFTLTSGTTAKIQGTKPDRHGFSYDADVDTSNNVITADITQQMTAAHGEAYCELVLFKSGQRIGTLNFVMMIQQAGLNDETDTSDSDLPDIIAEATEQMLTAEAYAKGTRNGTAVSSGQTGYHDNSKYYKEQAATQASNASTSATSSNTNALKAEGYAVGKQNGTTQTSGTYYHNNAQYYKEQAADSATTASTKAGEASSSANTASQKASAASTSAQTASDKALVAEGYAKGTQNGTPVGSTSPYYHNNAEYFKNLANPTVAANVSFNNSGTDMSSTNVQDGIVENRTSIQNLSNQTDALELYTKGKNKLVTNSASKTESGVTYTNIGDGTVICSGTQTGANAYHFLSPSVSDISVLPRIKAGGSYTLTGGKSAAKAVGINLYNGSNLLNQYIDDGSGVTFTIPSNCNKVAIYLYQPTSGTAQNETYQVMLRDSDMSDSTWEPIYDTIKQLTTDKVGMDLLSEVGAVNYARCDMVTQAGNGVTWTVNADKTVTATVTATASSDRMVFYNQDSTLRDLCGGANFELRAGQTGIAPNGKYKILGNPYLEKARIGIQSAGMYLYINKEVASGTYTFKPMLAPIEYTGPYVPYAKSNKELTEDLNKGQILEDYIGTGDNGVSVTGDGTKTLGTLLNELGTALLAKAQSLASNEYMEIRGLRVDGNWEVTLNQYQIFDRNSTKVTCDFATSILNYGNTGIYVHRTTVSSVANEVYANVATIKSSGVTFSTDKENVIGNGKVIKMFYRIYRRV